MKKILILLFMIGAFTFVNVDLFASSHDIFYGYDLDTQYQELGGQSLREFFYDNNLNYQLYGGTSSTGITIQNEYIYFDTQSTLTPFIFLKDTNNNTNYFVQGDVHYYNYSVEITDFTYLNYFRFYGATDVNHSIYSSDLSAKPYTTFYLQLVATQYGSTTARINMNDLYIINIDAVGIQLSKERLDFLFHVYKTLYDRELAYNDGYDSGYDDGYNNGYDSGNLDGYNDGYDDGLFDYHTGNNYGSYDFTLSEPYDQATQANISLLNIFSMIIGVAMSMLGFIINIDIFGISIAGILATLFIGVSFIWMLKLIRG